MLGIWIVVAVVMLVRMHYVNLGYLAPSPYDATESAQNYKSCLDEARTLNATGELPTR
jgi:hypothetical protein